MKAKEKANTSKPPTRRGGVGDDGNDGEGGGAPVASVPPGVSLLIRFQSHVFFSYISKCDDIVCLLYFVNYLVHRM